MELRKTYLRGSVLPTVIVAALLILSGLVGLMGLWEQQTLLFVRSTRLRQARADAESAFALCRLRPCLADTLGSEGFRLYDSLPASHVRIRTAPWGLYEAVCVVTSDSLFRACRLFGAEPAAGQTLCYADNRSALSLAGRTVLQGTLHLPQNGLIYGRVGSDFYRGKQVPLAAILRADAGLPQPGGDVTDRVAVLLNRPVSAIESCPDSLFNSFLRDSATVLNLGHALIENCTLRGRIVLYADELCIDSTCRMEHLLVCARKITVAAGTRITAQLFARDTVVVEPRAVLEYPSGVFAGQYAELGERAVVNGYAIVRDTVRRKKVSANYRQDRTARLRGLLWVDGVAQVQGVVSGQTWLRQAVYFSPQGYYKDVLYDAALLVNPHTALPLWAAEPGTRRKEAACVG